MKANIKVELSNNTLVVTKKFFKNAQYFELLNTMNSALR